MLVEIMCSNCGTTWPIWPLRHICPECGAFTTRAIPTDGDSGTIEGDYVDEMIAVGADQEFQIDFGDEWEVPQSYLDNIGETH